MGKLIINSEQLTPENNNFNNSLSIRQIIDN